MRCFQCQHFSISRSRNLCANIIGKPVDSLFEYREQPGGWAGGPTFSLFCLTTVEGAPFFASFAKGGNRKHLQ
jgi:hypothetical protein